MSTGRPSDELSRPHKRSRSSDNVPSSTAAAQLKELGMTVAALLDPLQAAESSPSASEKTIHVLIGAGAFLNGAQQYHLTHRFIALRLFLSIVQLCTHDVALVKHCLDHLNALLLDELLCAHLMTFRFASAPQGRHSDTVAAPADSSEGASTVVGRSGSGRGGDQVGHHRAVVERCLGACRALGVAIGRHHAEKLPPGDVLRPFWTRRIASDGQQTNVVLRSLIGISIMDGIVEGCPRGAPLGQPTAPMPGGRLLLDCVEQCLTIATSITECQRSSTTPQVTGTDADAQDIAWAAMLRVVTTIVKRRQLVVGELMVVFTAGFTLISWALRTRAASTEVLLVCDCLAVLVGSLALVSTEDVTPSLFQAMLSTSLLIAVHAPSTSDASDGAALRSLWSLGHRLLNSLVKMQKDNPYGGRGSRAADVTRYVLEGEDGAFDATRILQQCTQLVRTSTTSVTAASLLVRIIGVLPQFGDVLVGAGDGSEASYAEVASFIAVVQWGYRRSSGEALRPQCRPQWDAPTFLQFVLSGGWVNQQLRPGSCDNEEAEDVNAEDELSSAAFTAAIRVLVHKVVAPSVAPRLQCVPRQLFHLCVNAGALCDELVDVLRWSTQAPGGVDALLTSVFGHASSFAALQCALVASVRGAPQGTTHVEWQRLLAALLEHAAASTSRIVSWRVAATLWIYWQQAPMPRGELPLPSVAATSTVLRSITSHIAAHAHSVDNSDDVLIDALRWTTACRLSQHREAWRATQNSARSATGVAPASPSGLIDCAEMELCLGAACTLTAAISTDASTVKALLQDIVGTTIVLPMERGGTTVVQRMDKAIAASRPTSDDCSRIVLEAVATVSSDVMAGACDHDCLQLVEFALDTVLACDADNASRQVRQGLGIMYPLAAALIRIVLESKQWNLDVFLQQRLVKKLVLPVILAGPTASHHDDSRLARLLRLVAPAATAHTESFHDLGVVLCKHNADQVVAAVTAASNDSPIVQRLAAALPNAAHVPAAIACCILRAVDACQNTSGVASTPRGRGKAIEELSKNLFGFDVHGLPKMCEKHFSAIVVALLSLAAGPLSDRCCDGAPLQDQVFTDAQQRLCDAVWTLCGLGSLTDRLPDGVVTAAMIDRACAQQSKADASKSSAAMPTCPAAQRLLRNLFDVLHTVLKRMHFEDDGVYHASASGAPSCTLTARRWLIGLILLAPLLRDDVVQLMQKLPAILHFTARGGRTLVVLTARMWSTLANVLPDSFVSTNTAVLLSELVALEESATALYKTESGGFGLGMECALASLKDAAVRLYRRSADVSFWKLHCTAVLSDSSLVRDIIAMMPPHAPNATSSATVLRGFAEAMDPSHNPSATCKAVFLRGLKTFLASRPLTALLECADIVNSPQHPLPLRRLLSECIRTSSRAPRPDHSHHNSEDVAYLAAFCLGMIGSAGLQQPQADEHALIQTVAYCESSFSLQHLFDWRQLLHSLLGVHLVRALASTSDSLMHDRAALSIQSLLRSGVRHERIEARSTPLLDADRVYVDELDRHWWWSKLPSLTKALLAPFTSTKYSPYVRSARTFSVPEFNAQCSPSSVEEWLFSWYCSLTERVSGTFLGEAAFACRNTAKKDVGLRDCLLPHLVFRVITKAPVPPASADKPQDVSDVDAVVAELEAVFAAASTHPVHAQRATMVLDAVDDVWTFCKLHAKKQSPVPCTIDKDTLARWGSSLTSFFTGQPRVSVDVRSRAAAACGLFHRSLRTLEGQKYFPPVGESIAQNPNMLLSYSALGDDLVAAHLGRASSSSAAIDDATLLEQAGQWDLAKRVAERHLQHHPNSRKHQLILVRCMRHLGESHLTSRYVRSVLLADGSPLASPADTAELRALGQEASWRMGEWTHCDTNDVASPRSSVSASCRESLASSVKALMNVATDRAHCAQLEAITHQHRHGIMDRIVSTSTAGDTTERALLEDLYVLSDIDAAAHYFVRHAGSRTSPPATNDEEHNELLAFFVGRAERADPTADIKETLLSLRRVVFHGLGRMDVVSSAWVEEAKALRKRSKIDAALQAVLHAAQHPRHTCVKYFTEAAKLWWLKDPSRGIEFAEAVVRGGSAATTLPAEVTAKMLTYATKWKHELIPQPDEEVVSAYRRALDVHDSAKGQLCLAQFYDSLYEPLVAAATTTPGAKISSSISSSKAPTASADALVVLAIRHYAKSLVHSAKVSSIAMPRAMTLWLEHTALLAAEVAASPPASRSKIEAVIADLNALMESYFVGAADGGRSNPGVSKVSPILTMQALPQLTSRLAHVHLGTTATISKILLTLLGACPQQVLWNLIPVVRSIKQPRRAQVAKSQVASVFCRKGGEEQRLESSFNVIFNTLLDVCDAPPESFADPRVRLTQMPFIRKHDKAIAASKCIIPITSTISPDWTSLNAAPMAPTFTTFDDPVEVMSSLQKPKRIAIIGSDGVKYPFLCKAKDDPKKDIRMMEIVNRMNLLFQRDPESRKRQYRLRGYVVAALGDDYAMIEWVSNQCALRRAVEDTYSVDGSGIRTVAVRSLLAKVDAKQLTRMDMFKKHILVDAKPVFHQWFYHKFNDAASWYAARQRYTVSCALWCAVGHIVGLGDRHGENMLVDSVTGEAMHCDFACMFDKGELLQEPERVRFRLTQNVVDALGVLGVDGGFRSTFETALRTQIQNKSGLMCVLETLLHDPLIEWSDRGKADPRQLFHRVRRRLDGYLDLNARLKEFDPVARDASHQASRLIQHATHWDNLSLMYIWWMSWV